MSTGAVALRARLIVATIWLGVAPAAATAKTASLTAASASEPLLLAVPPLTGPAYDKVAILPQTPLASLQPKQVTAAISIDDSPRQPTADAASAKPQEGPGVPYRIRKPHDLARPLIRDPLVRVPGAQVAYRNRTALERDFSFAKNLSDEELDAWILAEFAYISNAQHALSGIRNSPIPFPDDLLAKENLKMGYRPPDYGRAAVLPVHDSRGGGQPVLVDVKGIGHHWKSWDRIRGQVNSFRSAVTEDSIDALRVRDHSDGLMSLGEAIAELTRQQAAQKLFEEHNAKHGTSLQTVDTYFIIALPFSILKDKGQRLQAALYGRQAHWGRAILYGVPKSIYTDPRGFWQVDGLRSAAVDFGAVLIQDQRLRNHFGEDDKGSPIRARWLSFKARLGISDPLGTSDPQSSKAWRYAHEAAAAFSRPDNPDVSVVYRHLQEMLKPLASLGTSSRPSRIMEFEEFVQRARRDSKLFVRWRAASALKRRSTRSVLVAMSSVLLVLFSPLWLMSNFIRFYASIFLGLASFIVRRLSSLGTRRTPV